MLPRYEQTSQDRTINCRLALWVYTVTASGLLFGIVIYVFSTCRFLPFRYK
jgi:hypothetical protein